MYVGKYLGITTTQIMYDQLHHISWINTEINLHLSTYKFYFFKISIHTQPIHNIGRYLTCLTWNVLERTSKILAEKRERINSVLLPAAVQGEPCAKGRVSVTRCHWPTSRRRGVCALRWYTRRWKPFAGPTCHVCMPHVSESNANGIYLVPKYLEED